MTIRNPSKEEIEEMLRNMDDSGGSTIVKNEEPQFIEPEPQQPSQAPIIESLNPSEEDLQSVAKEKKKKGAATVVSDKHQDFDIIDGARVKKKKSRFEPNPIKCKLPSSGLGYVGEGITKDGCIFLRRMSSDEMIKLAGIEGINSFNKICNELFEKCIVSDIDVKSMPIVDKIPVFIFLVGASLEKKINLKEVINCSSEKAKDIDFLIDVKELRDRVKQLDRKNFKYPFELKLSTFPNVKLKYIYPRISEESYFISDNDIDEDNVSKLYSEITKEISGEVDGTPVTFDDLHEVMKWMSLDDKKAMRNNIDSMNQYTIDLTYKYSEHCSMGAKCCKAKETFELNIQDLILELIKTLADT